jgi:hypothetical protein
VLIERALLEAFRKAADQEAFPEQLTQLGLSAWKPSKLYAPYDAKRGAHVTLDTSRIRPRLGSTVRDFASAATELLDDPPPVLPVQRSYRLVASHLDNAEAHRHLLQGVPVSPAGESRRGMSEVVELTGEQEKALRTSRNVISLAETEAVGLADADRLLARVGPELARLPDDQALQAASRIAEHYARLGQWPLAREVYLMLVERHPAHPGAADAYGWLIRHNSSSEARRRQETKQFILTTHVEAQPSAQVGGLDIKSGVRRGVDITQESQLSLFGSHAETRQWYQGSLKLAARLEALGPVFGSDPSIQFCLNAARRQLGDFEVARKWCERFRLMHPVGVWGDNAAGELWLANRTGPPPKSVFLCRQSATRPYLNGELDDACWQEAKPVVLRSAAGDTASEYVTKVRLTYDRDFLYLALDCRHPDGHQVPAVKYRIPDTDLRRYDRVALLLDLDRDYSTCFHLQVDQRGCVHDDCWGDRTWNPRWFVAHQSGATGWCVEAAIPLAELTGENVTVGKAWACNVVRVIPGKGVQAWSLPADVQPRTEGLGLLLFAADTKREP